MEIPNELPKFQKSEIFIIRSAENSEPFSIPMERREEDESEGVEYAIYKVVEDKAEYLGAVGISDTGHYYSIDIESTDGDTFKYLADHNTTQLGSFFLTCNAEREELTVLIEPQATIQIVRTPIDLVGIPLDNRKEYLDLYKSNEIFSCIWTMEYLDSFLAQLEIIDADLHSSQLERVQRLFLSQITDTEELSKEDLQNLWDEWEERIEPSDGILSLESRIFLLLKNIDTEKFVSLANAVGELLPELEALGNNDFKYKRDAALGANIKTYNASLRYSGEDEGVEIEANSEVDDITAQTEIYYEQYRMALSKLIDPPSLINFSVNNEEAIRFARQNGIPPQIAYAYLQLKQQELSLYPDYAPSVVQIVFSQIVSDLKKKNTSSGDLNYKSLCDLQNKPYYYLLELSEIWFLLKLNELDGVLVSTPENSKQLNLEKLTAALSLVEVLKYNDGYLFNYLASRRKMLAQLSDLATSEPSLKEKLLEFYLSPEYMSMREYGTFYMDTKFVKFSPQFLQSLGFYFLNQAVEKPKEEKRSMQLMHKAFLALAGELNRSNLPLMTDAFSLLISSIDDNTIRRLRAKAS